MRMMIRIWMLLGLAAAIFGQEARGQGLGLKDEPARRVKMKPPGSVKGRPPVRVIFDTDFGPDYDDVGALAMLHAMADSRECRILATIASNRHPYVAAALSVMNTYFGRPDIPIGVVRGKAVEIGAGQRWDSVIVRTYAHEVKDNDAAWDAVRLYRKILALQPDSSVTIVTVGFLTNMANLLRSGPDEYTALSGAELVSRKVRRLVSMAGRFDGKGGDIGEVKEASGSAGEAGRKVSDFKEFNVKMDTAASTYTFDHWPTPIIFSGFEIGVQIFTGLGMVQDAGIRHSPVKDVFGRCIPMDPHDKLGRMSWDETAVLVAVRGTEKYFDVVKGRVICYADGRTGWDAEGVRDLYLVEKMPPGELAGVIEGLMKHQPVRDKQHIRSGK